VVAPFAEGGAAAAGASNAGKGGIAAKLAKPDVVIQSMVAYLGAALQEAQVPSLDLMV